MSKDQKLELPKNRPAWIFGYKNGEGQNKLVDLMVEKFLGEKFNNNAEIVFRGYFDNLIQFLSLTSEFNDSYELLEFIIGDTVKVETKAPFSASEISKFYTGKGKDYDVIRSSVEFVTSVHREDIGYLTDKYTRMSTFNFSKNPKQEVITFEEMFRSVKEQADKIVNFAITKLEPIKDEEQHPEPEHKEFQDNLNEFCDCMGIDRIELKPPLQKSSRGAIESNGSYVSMAAEQKCMSGGARSPH